MTMHPSLENYNALQKDRHATFLRHSISCNVIKKFVHFFLLRLQVYHFRFMTTECRVKTQTMWLLSRREEEREREVQVSSVGMVTVPLHEEVN